MNVSNVIKLQMLAICACGKYERVPSPFTHSLSYQKYLSTSIEHIERYSTCRHDIRI